MFNRTLVATLSTAASIAWASAVPAQEIADTIYTGGSILTIDDARLRPRPSQ